MTGLFCRRALVLVPAHVLAPEAAPDQDLVPGLALVHGQNAIAPNLARVPGQGLALPDGSHIPDHVRSQNHGRNQDLARDHLRSQSLDRDHVLHQVHQEMTKQDLPNPKPEKITTKIQQKEMPILSKLYRFIFLFPVFFLSCLKHD